MPDGSTPSPHGPSACDVARRAPRTSTRSARASGTRSTPTSPSRARPGCPAIILHGTATLALAVSRVVARELDGDAARVRRRRRALHRLRPPAVRDHRARAGGRAGDRHRLRRRRARTARPCSAKECSRHEADEPPRAHPRRLNREPVDRVPYAVWRHFPAVDKLPRGPRAGDAPLPRALRLRLPEDHAGGRLRGGGVGLRGGRRGAARRPPRVRALRRARRRRLEDDPRARSRNRAGLRRADRDDHSPRLRSTHRRRARGADALLAAVARAQALRRPARRTTSASIRDLVPARSRRSRRR